MEKEHKELLKKIFGKEVKRYREIEINISQEEFAGITGLGTTHIGEIENGKKDIQITTMFRLSIGGFDVNKAFKKIKKDFDEKGIDVTEK